jgi:hypothetical protein
MMNEHATHEPPFSDSDDDVGRLLCDAYNVPPPPATLTQRLDRVVSQEWGKSPELALRRAAPLARSDSPGAVSPRAVSARSRWLKSAPIAACAALVIAAFLLLGKGSHAYAWASRVRALEQQGIVQLDGQKIGDLSDGSMSEYDLTPDGNSHKLSVLTPSKRLFTVELQAQLDSLRLVSEMCHLDRRARVTGWPLRRCGTGHAQPARRSVSDPEPDRIDRLGRSRQATRWSGAWCRHSSS